MRIFAITLLLLTLGACATTPPAGRQVTIIDDGTWREVPLPAR